MPDKHQKCATLLGGLISAVIWMPQSLQANEPLTAIDWLSQTPTVTLEMALPYEETPITDSVNVPMISVTPLSDEGRGGVGLLPRSITGLPADLWQSSPTSVLTYLIANLHAGDLPALQALLYTLLLAETNPPQDAQGQDGLLLARIDKLVELGALEQANALMQHAGVSTPDLFSRWFDVTLLMGQESRACDLLAETPRLAPNYATRVFCTARSGDWRGAALTLETANALKLVSGEEHALLQRYLDPELFAGEPLLFAATEATPLLYRLYEAIGETYPTTSLPLQFTHADLRSTAGWKAQLEAAERLARTGALPGNRLLGIYTERLPAASGMIWDRVDAIQELDQALSAGDGDDIAATLPAAWQAMQQARLEVRFANLFGAALLQAKLTGVAGDIAYKIALLSDDYEAAALTRPDDFLSGIATGTPAVSAPNAQAQAVSDAFHSAGVPQSLSTHLALGQLGEVILRAMILLSEGANGDLRAQTDALATLRAVGLEETARRAALQILILERKL
jgi:hypothetical protein